MCNGIRLNTIQGQKIKRTLILVVISNFYKFYIEKTRFSSFFIFTSLKNTHRGSFLKLVAIFQLFEHKQILHILGAFQSYCVTLWWWFFFKSEK